MERSRINSLLRDRLGPGVSWLVSAGHGRGAEVIQNLQNAQVPGTFNDTDMGFSDFIIQRRTYGFLGAG